jgi:hypothetical protein
VASDPVGLSAACSKKELASVAPLCISLDVAEGFVLTTQGTRGDECFVIGAGDAEVTIDGKAVATVGPGTASERCRCWTADRAPRP